MLSTPPSTRNPSTRFPFLQPPWDDQHPDFLRIDHELPDHHHARYILRALPHLDLEPFRRAYANRGSLAYPPQQLLPFVLFMYSQKIISPADWLVHSRTNDVAKWILRGLRPSRSQLYTFRNRTEPFLDAWHKQLNDWALAEKITSGKRASLDGTFVAALASRHRLLRAPVLDKRLALLNAAVWADHYPEDALTLSTALSDPQSLTTLAGVFVGLLTLLRECPLDLLAVLLLVLQLQHQPQVIAGAKVLAWMPRSVAGRQRMLRRYEQARQRLQQRLKPLRDKKKLSNKDEETIKRAKISPTDPEAALGYDKLGTYRTLYNVQLVTATDAPLVLAWDVFSRNNDDGLLQPMMEKTHEQLGHHLDDALVDGSYTDICGLLYCEEHDITVYGPPARLDKPAATGSSGASAASSPTQQDSPSTSVAQPVGHNSSVESVERTSQDSSNASALPPEYGSSVVGERAQESRSVEVQECEGANSVEGGQEEKQDGGPAPPRREAESQVGAQSGKGVASKAGKEEKKYGKELFRYDGEAEVYYCPQGKVLVPVSRTTVQRQGCVELPMVVHQAAAADCAACEVREKCTSGKGGRTVKRYKGEEVVEWLEERMKDPESQKIYRERKQTVELGFADLKEHRGLRVFRCFGIKRAQRQAGLTILAHNILNIVRALARREKPHLPPDGGQT